MKIYIDSAVVSEVKEAASWGIISGVTTNPSLAARAGQDYKSVLTEISALVSGPISAEVVGTTRDEMEKEARELAKIADNIIVKIPMTSEGLAATAKLNNDGIDINMTLVFTLNQALLATASGASYVSPFLGRLDDIGNDGLGSLAEMVQGLGNYDLDVQVIAASIRGPRHVSEAALIGADIATIPFKVLKQMMHHPLTDKGIASFLADWESLQAKLNKG